MSTWVVREGRSYESQAKNLNLGDLGERIVYNKLLGLKLKAKRLQWTREDPYITDIEIDKDGKKILVEVKCVVIDSFSMVDNYPSCLIGKHTKFDLLILVILNKQLNKGILIYMGNKDLILTEPLSPTISQHRRSLEIAKNFSKDNLNIITKYMNELRKNN